MNCKPNKCQFIGRPNDFFFIQHVSSENIKKILVEADKFIRNYKSVKKNCYVRQLQFFLKSSIKITVLFGYLLNSKID